MWDIVRNLAPTLWQLLPEATIGLRFGAALITFGLAAAALIRRLRRRPSSAPDQNRPGRQAPPSKGRSGPLTR